MTEHRTPADLREAATNIQQIITGVLTADVIDYDERLDRPAVEFIVGPEDGRGEYDRVPPRVHVGHHTPIERNVPRRCNLSLSRRPER